MTGYKNTADGYVMLRVPLCCETQPTPPRGLINPYPTYLAQTSSKNRNNRGILGVESKKMVLGRKSSLTRKWMT